MRNPGVPNGPSKYNYPSSKDFEKNAIFCENMAFIKGIWRQSSETVRFGKYLKYLKFA